jgi:peroxiredoxin
LRKSPQRTPKSLAARRWNAQHSTAPHTAAGKQNSKLNALKHGRQIVNYELPSSFSPPPTAVCLLPAAFEGSPSWRESSTVCSPGQDVTFRSERRDRCNFKK